MALGTSAQARPRPEAGRPGGLVLEDEDPLQRVKVGAHGVAVQRFVIVQYFGPTDCNESDQQIAMLETDILQVGARRSLVTITSVNSCAMAVVPNPWGDRSVLGYRPTKEVVEQRNGERRIAVRRAIDHAFRDEL